MKYSSGGITPEEYNFKSGVYQKRRLLLGQAASAFFKKVIYSQFSNM
ncbi:hypothetical protein NIES267_73850 (plasmid) [Calothrix parasitica NIES-267]|uniref:Uncharacterized protein n=1 Tax=Calothrix parasitica NIES-267 TaxID=1973488 RepID=A0A1Z4M397_9CYAN|nr:hypothetical protein NIES267_73850 [Calothrix parasitica NIES-267]